jgi:hypothetical protein
MKEIKLLTWEEIFDIYKFKESQIVLLKKSLGRQKLYQSSVPFKDFQGMLISYSEQVKEHSIRAESKKVMTKIKNSLTGQIEDQEIESMYITCGDLEDYRILYSMNYYWDQIKKEELYKGRNKTPPFQE